VDFDPDVVRALGAQGLDVRYGDAEDAHLLEQLPLARIGCIVSTLPRPEINASLLQALKSAGYAGHSVVAAHDEEAAARSQQAGAEHVLYPYRDAADHAAALVVQLVQTDATPHDARAEHAARKSSVHPA
jgi:Trk K+ transport system NAD-binding subunit